MNAQARIAFPDWPRLMQRQKAAAYVDMSIPKFEEEIAMGRLPASITIGGREHWCRKALDAAIDNLLNGNADVPDYVREMREKLNAQKAAETP